MPSTFDCGEVPFTPTILTVKPLDFRSGVVRIFDPMMTLHLTRVPLSFVDNAAIYRHVVANPAVYILVGPSDDEKFECSVYVGETGNGANRLSQHLSKREVRWDVAYVVSSDNLAINKAHVRSYECSLFALISQHPKMRMINVDVPKEFELAEYDTSLVERSFAVIVELLIAAGFPLAKLPLMRASELVEEPDNPPPNEESRGHYVFRPGPLCRYADLYGSARREGNEFVLLPGSEVRTATNPSFIEGVARRLVIKEGGLKAHPTREDRKIMTRPVRCSNWRSAASALAGADVTNAQYWVSNLVLGEYNSANPEEVPDEHRIPLSPC